MAQTPSNMLPIGTLAPNFILTDGISEKQFQFSDLKGENGTFFVFICNHCPFVHHVIEEIVIIANQYFEKGIKTIAISSNDIIKYPQDNPELMAVFAKQHHFSFPYLFDESQEVAKKYDAACTPDFYLFNNQDKLVYRGQLDDSRPGNGIPVSGTDVRNAIENMLNNIAIHSNQKPSIGCNIKWK